MRILILTMISRSALGAFLLCGCGSAGANSGGGGEPEQGPAPATPIAPRPDQGGAIDGPVGVWENGSCGERKYRRRIEFFADGRFAALDEVAPCPPGARCVWSGIIRWLGTWSMEDRRVSISVKPLEGEKLPEAVPDFFEFSPDPPATLAERTGDLLCPYRRTD